MRDNLNRYHELAREAADYITRFVKGRMQQEIQPNRHLHEKDSSQVHNQDEHKREESK